MKKVIFLFLLFFLLFLPLFLNNISLFFEKEEKKDTKITIYAVGDIMLDRGVEYMINKHGDGDFRFPFLKIENYLNQADILFGNLESVISDKGVNVGSIYSFRADPKSIEGLLFSGFDILSVSNNHSFDYGPKAFEDSLRRISDSGIIYTGGGLSREEAFSLSILEKKGNRIGFLAYSIFGNHFSLMQEEKPGIAVISEDNFENILKDIEVAKNKVDILIISIHWGEEYKIEPNLQQVSWGRKFIDRGADLILGHHPHVIQRVEKYNDGWIAYSLGNFVFDQYFSKETMEGLVLEVEIEEGKIKEVKGKEIRISETYQPFDPYD